MDNLTHSLLGAVMGRVGLREKVPGGTLALVVVANLPDADVVASAWGSLYYLHYHRGVTHSIVGTVVLAVASAAALWALGRRRAHPARFLEVLFAVLVVAATHPLLDLTNSYGLRPFLPFLGHWYYGDLVFIVDPYLWILLGTALYLTGRSSRWRRVAWIIGLILTSAVILVGASRFGRWELILFWPAAIALNVIVKRRLPALRPVSVAGLALAAVLVYWAALGGLHALTLARIYPEIQARFPAVSAERIAATPTPVTPLRWEVFFEDDTTLYYSQASPFSGLITAVREFPRNVETAAAQAALATCAGAVFVEFARYEIFEIGGSNDEPVVTIKDARFSILRGENGFGVLRIPLGKADQIPCPRGR